MDRQRIFDRPKPPSFWAVVDEDVLCRRIGGGKVMHDQRVHLADMAGRASIKIQVIRPRRARVWGCWVPWPSSASLVTRRVSFYFESPDEGQTTRDPGTVAKVTLAFEILRSEALPRGA
jgi:hypothetical protein